MKSLRVSPSAFRGSLSAVLWMKCGTFQQCTGELCLSSIRQRAAAAPGMLSSLPTPAMRALDTLELLKWFQPPSVSQPLTV